MGLTMSSTTNNHGTAELPSRPKVPVLYWAMGGIGTVACTSLFGGAALSGLLSGHGMAWPGNIVATLTRWTDNFGDPAAAWNHDPRPGPAWLVYGLAAVIASAMLALWWWAAVVWGARQMRRRAPRDGLARTSDVAGLLGRDGAKQHGQRLRPSLAGTKLNKIDDDELVMTLGTNVADGEPIAIRPNDSLLILGGSGQGKTHRTGIKPVLSAPGFVLSTSTKADVLRATCLHRQNKGDVAVFDPEDLAPGWPNKARWSPLAGSEDPDTAIRRAGAIVSGRSGGGDADSEASRFYSSRATTLIKSYLHAAAVDGRRMSDVRRWSGVSKNREVIQILERHRPDWAAEFAQATEGGDPKTLANIMATVAGILAPLGSPKLMAAVDVDADESLNLEYLIGGSNSLYLLSEGQSESMAPYIAAMVTEVHYLAKRTADRMPDQRLDPFMRMVLDEVANIAAVKNLGGMLTDSGGRGIQMVLYVHGKNQLVNRFGTAAAHQIFESISGRLVIPGLMSQELLEDTSKLLGTVQSWRTVPGTGDQWRDQPIERPVMSPEAIRTMPEDQALLVYRNQPGVLLHIPAWWEDGDRTTGEVVRASQAHYDKIIAAGQIIDTGAPEYDTHHGVEVLDLTKGWRR